jgi:hypothetical protein
LCFYWLVGCQTLSEKHQASILEDTLRKYEATMRWGSLQNARSFQAEDVLFSPSANKDLRIIHYEVVQGPTQVSEDKALQTVLIQYVFESRQSVKELVDQQVWQYKEDRWFLQSPLPVFQ